MYHKIYGFKYPTITTTYKINSREIYGFLATIKLLKNLILNYPLNYYWFQSDSDT